MKKLLILILIMALLAAGGALLLRSGGSSGKPIVTLEGLNAIYEDKILDASDFDRIDGQVYLSFDFVKENLDNTIRFEKGENTVIIAKGNELKRLPLNSSTGTLNEKEFSIRDPLIEKDGKILLPIEVFIYQYDVTVRYIEEQQLIIIDRTDTAYVEGVVLKEELSIRREEDEKSDALSNLTKGDRIYVYEEYAKSYKVRAETGVPGYVPKDAIKLDLKTDKFKHTLLPRENEQVVSSPPTINLTWDYTYGKLEDGSTAQHIPGVNVIAPTWFSVTDGSGTVVDKGNWEYAKKYHDMGVAIWGTIDNSFDKDITKAFLASSSSRGRIIAQIMDYIKLYDLQGINIDFENIEEDDRENLVQFTRELTACLKSIDKVSSIDVTPVSDSAEWSRVYDRKTLSSIVDYVVVMAYDQHWASSPVAGSVAQYKWVEGSINGLFKSIPVEKMILGIPLYTRLWIEENGQVTSKAIGMEEAKKFIDENGIQTFWDEDSRQHFGTIEKDGKTYKIWLETEESIVHKASLVTKYGLAGVGTWRKGFEQPHIWQALEKSLF